MPLKSPTKEQSAAFSVAFNYLNRELFDGLLPEPILNFSRQRGCVAFFVPKKWKNGRLVRPEISINPSTMADLKAEGLAAALVHEMVHLWQDRHGRPGRRGYHNREWAAKMEEIGLGPSDTGRPGGKRTGERVSHYVISDGAFAGAFRRLPIGGRIPWIARTEPIDRSRNKVRYLCRGCAGRVWGGPGLRILCLKCRRPFGRDRIRTAVVEDG